MRWIIWTALAFGCGGGTDGVADTDAKTETDPTAAETCDDPSYNPLAGTCVEDYLAGCFDPSGACDLTFDAQGNTTLTWENGASVVTTLDMSGGASDPVAITELIASDGAVCAEGMSENGVGGCASRTVYQRPDGALQTWCFQTDGSYEVTCDDGTTITVTASQSEAAQACQYGADAGPCM